MAVGTRGTDTPDPVIIALHITWVNVMYAKVIHL
jgi:hypothetical protein